MSSLDDDEGVCQGAPALDLPNIRGGRGPLRVRPRTRAEAITDGLWPPPRPSANLIPHRGGAKPIGGEVRLKADRGGPQAGRKNIRG